jgi:membrane protein required for colicin V production
MVWIDLVIGLLLLLEILKGLKSGFAKESGTIIGILVGFIMASACGNTMARFLSAVCGDSILWSRILGFLLTFLAVFLLILILSKIFEGFLKVFALDWMNKAAGGVFCLLKGLLVLSVVLNLYQAIDKDCSLIGTQRVKDSVLYGPVRNFAPTLFPSLKLFQHPGDPVDEGPKTMNV